MENINTHQSTKSTDFRKVNGAHYTPKVLADFVAEQIVEAYEGSDGFGNVRILDPGVGDGELLRSLVTRLLACKHSEIEVTGFDTDPNAIETATERIKEVSTGLPLRIKREDFVDFALGHNSEFSRPELFKTKKFDLVIANPPYVRTQVMGANQSQYLAKNFGLSGRIDLYHVFIHGIGSILRKGGIAGIIVSNRFMTTKSGAAIRQRIKEEFEVLHVWDLGDTRIFEAAVLPAVLLLKKRQSADDSDPARFTSIYSTQEESSSSSAENVVSALSKEGIVSIGNDRQYEVRKGVLASEEPNGVWRLSTKSSEQWLDEVNSHTFCTFGDVGKIRVGVKTTADKIFIRSDWERLPKNSYPEILRPLITHHIGRRFKSEPIEKKILYPHIVRDGKREVVDLQDFPRAQEYLESHKAKLEGREYVLKAGREWFEIWVPQDPLAWAKDKIVFRDIAEKPMFWLDREGAVVNGDCYWLVSDAKQSDDLLWLCLAVGNSSFSEVFYDHKFNNKLYAGRRRFMTQYVEKFPLPDPTSEIGKKLIDKTKELYKLLPSKSSDRLEEEINSLVWKSFGVVKEAAR